MLKIIQMLLSRSSCCRGLPAFDQEVPPKGYYLPYEAAVLADAPLRRDCIQKIWENSSLPADVWQRFYQTPIHGLLVRVQNIPASAEGRWACAGGFADLSLRFTSCVVRLAKGYMFPPGATPEDQAAQGAVWHTVIFWTALFYHLPLLARLEGELENGSMWFPGVSVPERAYRFRFSVVSQSEHYASALSSMIALQLLPADAIAWVSGIPCGVQNLAIGLWCNQPVMPLVRKLLQQAAVLTESPLFEGNGNSKSVSDEQSACRDMNTSGSDSLVPVSMDDVIPLSFYDAHFSTEEKFEESLIIPESSLNKEEKPASEVCTNSECQEGKGTSLSIFNENVPINTEGNISQEVMDMVDSEERVEKQNAEIPSGNEFILWLKKGLAAKEISINQPDSRIHIVARYAFLCVPDIFFRFMRENGKKYHRNALQKEFEKLRLHKVQQGERFVKARLYDTEDWGGNISGSVDILFQSSISIMEKDHLRAGVFVSPVKEVG